MLRLSACVGVAAVLSAVLPTCWCVGVGVGVALYLLTGGWYWVKIAWRTLPRDLRLIKLIAYIELSVKGWNKKKMVIGDIFAEVGY